MVTKTVLGMKVIITVKAVIIIITVIIYWITLLNNF